MKNIKYSVMYGVWSKDHNLIVMLDRTNESAA